MTIPVLGRVDFKWLTIGIVFAMFVWPYVSGMLRRL